MNLELEPNPKIAQLEMTRNKNDPNPNSTWPQKQLNQKPE